MIAPQPFKFVCPKCGYTKVVKPKSDALNPMDFMSTCPKCTAKMDKKLLGFLDKLFKYIS
jgi:transcription elongation factor Elf1